MSLYDKIASGGSIMLTFDNEILEAVIVPRSCPAIPPLNGAVI